MTWRHCKVFWRCFVYLVKFSNWSKFHVNIITGSRVMTISFHKGLTRNPKIENTSTWVLPNIWRLGRVRNTKFGTDVPNKILLNAAKCPGYNFYCFCIIKGKSTGGVKLRPHPPPTQSRVNIFTWKENRNRFITVLKTGRDNLTICFVYTEVWFPFAGKLSSFNYFTLNQVFLL